MLTGTSLLHGCMPPKLLLSFESSEGVCPFVGSMVQGGEETVMLMMK